MSVTAEPTKMHPQQTSGTCALVSGGLDSAVLMRQLLASGHRVLPCYLRCGLRWEATELYWLRRVLRAMRSPRLLPLAVGEMPLRSIYGPHWSLSGRRIPGPRSADSTVYLPGRNLLLVGHAAVLCSRRGLSTIALGVLKGNPFGDATPGFFSQLAGCLTQALGRPFRILTPLRRFSKTQLIRATAKTPWKLTFSCLNPQGRWHCGRCNKCAERQRAFHRARIADPTRYAAA